jgi:hypothetical protein
MLLTTAAATAAASAVGTANAFGALFLGFADITDGEAQNGADEENKNEIFHVLTS